MDLCVFYKALFDKALIHHRPINSLFRSHILATLNRSGTIATHLTNRTYFGQNERSLTTTQAAFKTI